MEHIAQTLVTTRYEGILRVIQKQLADQVKTPFEIRLWGDRIYRFGKGEPAVKVLVKDRHGLAVRLHARIPCGGRQIADGSAGSSQRPAQLHAHLHCLGEKAGGCER